MKQKITYKQLGGHVHCRMFTSHDGHNWAKNGDLVFDEKEWNRVKERFGCAGIICALEDKTYGEVYELPGEVHTITTEELVEGLMEANRIEREARSLVNGEVGALEARLAPQILGTIRLREQ